MSDIEIVFFNGTARKIGRVENYWAASGFLRVLQEGSSLRVFPLCNIQEIKIRELKPDGD